MKFVFAFLFFAGDASELLKPTNKVLFIIDLTNSHVLNFGL